MADVVTREVRSRMMAGIKGKNTAPELALRKGLHKRGYRFRINRRDLPGAPDLVFPGLRAVLFAHGCFWHGHRCHLFKWPTSRADFWHTKLNGNVERDEKVRQQLESGGWRIGIIWECAMKGRHRKPLGDILDSCATWLSSDALSLEIAGDEARVPV
jgi:DNA mismatch endonuclease (patch repair protein)